MHVRAEVPPEPIPSSRPGRYCHTGSCRREPQATKGSCQTLQDRGSSRLLMSRHENLSECLTEETHGILVPSQTKQQERVLELTAMRGARRCRHARRQCRRPRCTRPRRWRSRTSGRLRPRGAEGEGPEGQGPRGLRTRVHLHQGTGFGGAVQMNRADRLRELVRSAPLAMSVHRR